MKRLLKVFLSLLFVVTGITILSSCGKRTYTVSFETNGGSVIAPIKVKEGNSLVLPDDPIKEGFDFDSWYIDEELNAPYEEQIISFDFTLYARYRVKNFTITFMADNQTVSTQTVAYGSNLAIIPPVPAKEGYNGAWDVTDFTNITANKTVNAVYTQKSYTVKFVDYDGSTIIQVNGKDTQQVKHGELAILPNNPTRVGYTFANWSIDVTAPVTGETTYRAIYDQDQVPVIFRKHDGTILTNVMVNYGGNVDVSSIPAVPNRDGYTGVWEPIPTNIIMDTEIHPIYTPIDYTITFNSNGGSEVASITQGFDTILVAPSNPTKAGYTFGGWYTEDTWNNQFIFSEVSRMPLNGLTLYAKWNIVSYTVTFYGFDDVIISTEQVDYNSLITPPTKPEVTGYDAGEWMVGSDVWNPNTPVTSTLNIKLVYTPKTYTVTFDVDGLLTTKENVAYGSTLASTDFPTPTKVGYTFNTWEPSVTTVIRNNTTFTAKWIANTYTLTFDVNEGDELTSSSKQVTYDSIVNTLETPVRDGYTFTGWYIDSDKIEAETVWTYTEDKTAIANWSANEGTEYTINHYTEGLDGTYSLRTSTKQYGTTDETGTASSTSIPGFTYDESNTNNVKSGTILGDGTLELSLYYTRNSYTISFDSDMPSINAKYEEEIELPTPTKVGHTFNAWLLNNNPYETTTMPLGGAHLTASWTVNSYTITFYDQNKTIIGEPVSKEFGSSISAPSVSIPEGYTFGGWYEDSEYFIRYTFTGFSAMPDVNINFYLRLIPVEYSVIFRIEVGTGNYQIIESRYVAHGSTITAPAQLEITGYNAGIWMVGSEVWNSTVPVTSSLTITSTYSLKTYTVTFYNVDGTTVKQTVNDVIYGSDLTHITADTNYVWDHDVSSISSDLHVKQISTSLNDIIVAFYSDNSFSKRLDYKGQLLIYYTLDVNNNPIGIAGGDANKVYPNSTISSLQPIESGKVFAGWYYSDGSMEYYLGKDSITVPSSVNTSIGVFDTSYVTAIEFTTVSTNAGTIVNIGIVNETATGGYGSAYMTATDIDGGIKYSQGSTVPISILTDKVFQVYAKWKEILVAPTITTSVDGIVSWESITNATYYKITIDGIEQENMITTTSFDLSTLELGSGSHTITVKSYCDDEEVTSGASNMSLYVIGGTDIESNVQDYYTIEKNGASTTYIFFTEMSYNLPTDVVITADPNNIVSLRDHILETNNKTGFFTFSRTSASYNALVVPFISSFSYNRQLQNYVDIKSNPDNSDYLNKNIDVYQIGNKNPFYFDLSIYGKNSTIKNFEDIYVDYSFEKKNGGIYEPVSASLLIDSVDNGLGSLAETKASSKLKFYENANGIYRVTITPRYSPGIYHLNPLTLEFTLNDGYNAFTHEEFKDLYANTSIKTINLHSDIEVRLSEDQYAGNNQPLNFNYSHINGATVNAVLEYNKAHPNDKISTGGSAYMRFINADNLTNVEQELTINGNYFTVDGSKLPYVGTSSYGAYRTFTHGGNTYTFEQQGSPARNDGIRVEGVHIGIFQNIAYDPTPRNITPDEGVQIAETDFNVIYNNMTVLGNTKSPSVNYSQSASEVEESIALMSKNSGGYCGVMATRSHSEFNNVNFGYTTMAIYVDMHNSGIEMNYTKVYDSWANSIYGYSCHDITVNDSYLGRSGGAAILVDDDIYMYGYTYDPIVNIQNTEIENWITGSEPWFIAWNFQALAITLKAQIGTGLAPYNQTMLKLIRDPATGLESEMFNWAIFFQNQRNKGQFGVTMSRADYNYANNRRDFSETDFNSWKADGHASGTIAEWLLSHPNRRSHITRYIEMYEGKDPSNFYGIQFQVNDYASFAKYISLLNKCQYTLIIDDKVLAHRIDTEREDEIAVAGNRVFPLGEYSKAEQFNQASVDFTEALTALGTVHSNNMDPTSYWASQSAKVYELVTKAALTKKYLADVANIDYEYGVDLVTSYFFNQGYIDALYTNYAAIMGSNSIPAAQYSLGLAANDSQCVAVANMAMANTDEVSGWLEVMAEVGSLYTGIYQAK